MPRDAQATRERILAAAVEEYARHGLAGARVDRIAANAPANKRAIYEYFGDKVALFVAVQEVVTRDLMTSVPLDPADLPGYAGRLFDYHQARPAALRMNQWRQLELPDLPDSVDPAEYAAFLRSVQERPGAAEEGALPALDLSQIVFSVVTGWSMALDAYLQVAGVRRDDPDAVARYRASVVEAVRRLGGGSR
jgi:AcrR family transcriptional regulator